MIKSGGWKCPHCRMGSPRHWNVERHIWRLHQGLGEPVNEFGKTKDQCLIDMNPQFRYNTQNSQFSAFRHDQFKESRFSATHNHGIDNNSKRSWDFMDEITVPAKKILEFNKVLIELSKLNQQTNYYSPAISHQYPSHINLTSVGSMNIGYNSSSRSLAKETNDKRITEGEPILRQLHARAAVWYQSRNWSSPSGYLWEQYNTT
jgi:hypothetical protein